VVGIAVTTAALVILISAFNGIETMIEKLYSEFDADITVRASEGKTFDRNTLDLKLVRQVPGVASVSRAIEEIVVLKHEKKSVNARMIAIEPEFLAMSDMSQHIVDGFATLDENGESMALIGATLLDKLNGFIPQTAGYETVIAYFPKREAKVTATSNPFRTQVIKISGRINFNREVNAESFILPIALAQDMLDYGDDITALYVKAQPGTSVETIQSALQEKLGKRFKVSTHLEKNALIYQTSKSEKIIVIAILIFIFILAAFNLVASLTMLFIEKKDNIRTMESFGANENFIFRIFFYEGLLIASKGIVIGLLLGYGICFLQIYGHLLEMPNSGGEAFPIHLTWMDGVLVLCLVGVLSVLASYLPVSYLIFKNKAKV
jgi:lipoprotein-releasing system permease protein